MAMLIDDPAPVRSSDRDDAQARVSAVFSPHRLEVVSPRQPLDVVLRTLRLPNLTLGEISHGAEVEVTPGRLRTYYHVNTVLAGHTRSECGRDMHATSQGNAAILSPDERSSMLWSADCVQLAVKLDRSAVEAELSAVLGYPAEAPLVFDLFMDTRSGAGRSWLRSVRSLIEECNEIPEIAGQPLIARRFESLIIAQLLVSQANNYSEAIAAGGREPARPRRVQAVVDLIHERPGDPLTASDLARASGISLRSLQEDFREHLGVPPMAYLRNIRLARAREELQSAQVANGVSVADIAFKWGFGHVSRFAASYRERFGEAPSVTLRN